MKRSDLFPTKTRQAKPPAGEPTPAELADLELLKQELGDMKQAAIEYFSNFTIPPRPGEAKGQWQAWLLVGVDDLDSFKGYPQRVDFVLKNLDWFKQEIQKIQARSIDDELPYHWLD